MIIAVRVADRTAGAVAVPIVLFPWMLLDGWRRVRDYRHWKMSRSLLPPDFWGGCQPFRHYARMIVHWQESLAACLLSNRLHEQRWRRRITIEGTSPHHLPGWGERPLIVAYLHTGSFVFLGYWLRASGLQVASFVQARPPVLR